jgi:hypothetical protein
MIGAEDGYRLSVAARAEGLGGPEPEISIPTA